MGVGNVSEHSMEQDQSTSGQAIVHVPPQPGSVIQSSNENAANGKKQKKKQGNMKTTWILTYGASGPYITPQMLLDLGKINVDECHCTKDRAMAVTYIHLIHRVRQSSIEEFMKKAKETHGIVQNSIYGYEAIACIVNKGTVSTIEEHVGFRMLLRHYLAKDPAFIPWTDGEPVLKRGKLLRAAEIDPELPTSMASKTKTQIIAYAKQLECKLKEANALLQSGSDRHQPIRNEDTGLMAETSTLRSENAALIVERMGLRSENAALKRKIHELEGHQT